MAEAKQLDPRITVCIVKRGDKEVAKIPAAARDADKFIEAYAPCSVDYVEDSRYCDVYYMLHPGKWRLNEIKDLV